MYLFYTQFSLQFSLHLSRKSQKYHKYGNIIFWCLQNDAVFIHNWILQKSTFYPVFFNGIFTSINVLFICHIWNGNVTVSSSLHIVCLRRITSSRSSPFLCTVISMSLYSSQRHTDRGKECKTLIEGHICLSSHLSVMIFVSVVFSSGRSRWARLNSAQTAGVKMCWCESAWHP